MKIERAAKWILNSAGIYGLLVIIPGFFTEGRFSILFPPAITHPEFYYGFYSVALAWQIAFLVMATAPRRYRILLIPAMVEKGMFSVLIAWLFVSGRVAGTFFAISLVDAILCALFAFLFLGLRSPESKNAA